MIAAGKLDLSLTETEKEIVDLSKLHLKGAVHSHRGLLLRSWISRGKSGFSTR